MLFMRLLPEKTEPNQEMPSKDLALRMVQKGVGNRGSYMHQCSAQSHDENPGLTPSSILGHTPLVMLEDGSP